LNRYFVLSTLLSLVKIWKIEL